MNTQKRTDQKIPTKKKKEYEKPQAKLTKISMGVWAGSCGSCLSPSTKIATPSGEADVKKLKVGYTVWTIDHKGKKRVAALEKVSKTKVSETHHMIYLVLSDGRTLLASPDHPLADVRKIRQIAVGETYDGAKVLDVELVFYHHSYTYDILPQGDTGCYWADGILIGSTLFQQEIHPIVSTFSHVEFLQT